VALSARGANTFVSFTSMARGAGNNPMRILKRKPGFVMVKYFGPTPFRLTVTILARLT
jgi:hypothetical protein